MTNPAHPLPVLPAYNDQGNTMALTKWTPTTDLMQLRRLGKLGEECGELSAVASRCIIQGIDEVDPSSGKTNRQRLTEEVADVMAQCNTTIARLGLDARAVATRITLKERHMAEWEAMFAPSYTGEWPRPGDLVRYDGGSTALVLHGQPHAGGWHGTQCMGGTTFYTRVHRPTDEDRQTWVECAVRWRGLSRTDALAEAGLNTKG